MATGGPSGLPIPPGVATPLQLATYIGAPAGMARDNPQHELLDTEAWTIIDGNLTDPGFIRRRGPLTEIQMNASGSSAGITRAQDPAGNERYLLWRGGGGGQFAIYTSAAALTTVAAGYNPKTGPGAALSLFDSKDALGAGTLIGGADTLASPGTTKMLAYWRGATADKLAVTVTGFGRGATTIAASSVTGIMPGQFVFTNATPASFVGVVKSISGLNITLEDPAVAAGGPTVNFQAVRGLVPRVAVGRITCDTTSATVNGGLTKFSAQGLASGTWDIFTPDHTYVGTVSSVASDAQLTLSANAAVSLLNSPYIAVQRSQAGYTSTASPVLGWLNAQFAGHQFYADGNVLRFSSPLDPEAVDMSADGDFLSFSSDPITALIPTTNALVVCTEKETYILVGAVGTTPDKWRGERLLDDGCISTMTAQQYKGGAVWAGKQGVWFYGGANPVNIVAKLDDDYRKLVHNIAFGSAWGMIAKDHYLVFIEGANAGVIQRVEDTTIDVTRPTLAVDLNTGNISVWENVEIRGSVQVPKGLNVGTSVLWIGVADATTHTNVLDGDALFDPDGGQDAYKLKNALATGPSLFVETKRFSMGDGQRLKLFRTFQLWHFTHGGNLKMGTSAGLDAAQTISNDQFLDTSGVWGNQRIKFNRKSQYVAVRLWESNISGDPNAPSPPAANQLHVILGQWAFAFKWKRAGRV